MASVTAKERAAYSSKFEKADKDNDGKINYKEFCELVKDCGINYPRDFLYDLFDAVDKDTNNSIDLDEFCRMMPPVTVSEEYLKEFEKHDLNNDGVLDVKELQFAMMSQGKFRKSEAIQKLIESVDKNADGKVNYAEFVKVVPKMYQ